MFIYCITNEIEPKAYIGACSNLAARWRVHLDHVKHGRGKCRALYAAMRLHGVKHFHITAIWSGHIHGLLGRKKLAELERYFIRSFQTKSPNGYNLTDGGAGLGKGICEETRQIMSRINIERCARNGGGINKGKTFSDAHKARLSSATKKFFSENPDVMRERINKMRDGVIRKAALRKLEKKCP
jgi:group I intron endonuclease